MATKEDLLTQIRADLNAKTEPQSALKERRKRVNAAKSDEAATKAYFEHIEERRTKER